MKKKIFGFGLLIMVVILISPFIVFDTSKPAYLFDEDYHLGKRVVLGPCPRYIFSTPSYHDFLYSGNEWPFHIFKPYCMYWSKKKGFAKPSAWRK